MMNMRRLRKRNFWITTPEWVRQSIKMSTSTTWCARHGSCNASRRDSSIGLYTSTLSVSLSMLHLREACVRQLHLSRWYFYTVCIFQCQ